MQCFQFVLRVCLSFDFLSVCRLVRKQLAFILARQQVFLELDDAGLEETVDLTDIMSNVLLNNNFLALAREVSTVTGNNPTSLFNLNDLGTFLAAIT